MKKLLVMAMVASSSIAVVAASTQANAGKRGDYAKEYCQYYKNKAVWTGSAHWWEAYYACMEDNR